MTPEQNAILRGIALDNDAHFEARGESHCDMGVGCVSGGPCFAQVSGRPDMCGRKAGIACCSRCGSTEIDTSRWETGWPNYGRIELGFAAQAFGALCGTKNGANPEHALAWHKGHPAMVENGAQSVIFEWGAGYKFDSKERYRLCRECQRSLLAVVGKFFGYGESP